MHRRALRLAAQLRTTDGMGSKPFFCAMHPSGGELVSTGF
jgi:hypothetical protein